jgi:hypothetical protein
MRRDSAFRVSDAYGFAVDIVGYIQEGELTREEAERFIDSVRSAALADLETVAWPSAASGEESVDV